MNISSLVHTGADYVSTDNMHDVMAMYNYVHVLTMTII